MNWGYASLPFPTLHLPLKAHFVKLVSDQCPPPFPPLSLSLSSIPIYYHRGGVGDTQVFLSALNIQMVLIKQLELADFLSVLLSDTFSFCIRHLSANLVRFRHAHQICQPSLLLFYTFLDVEIQQAEARIVAQLAEMKTTETNVYVTTVSLIGPKENSCIACDND